MPPGNQQTGCSVAGSESTAVMSRSTGPTNAPPSATWPAQLISAYCPPTRSSGTPRAEVARVDGHSPPGFGRRLGRRADEHRDFVAGSERLMQHVATQTSGRAQDDDAGHQNPTFTDPENRRGIE